MSKGWTRRSVLAGAAAIGPAIIVRPTRAADYKFAQYHNQAASTPLHKNLTAMWQVIAAETGGRVEATVLAENDKVPGGDPDALKMLISGEIQFFTLMGGIIGTVVPVAEAQQLPFAFKTAAEAHKAIDGPLGGDGGQGYVPVSSRRLRQRHAPGRLDPAADCHAVRFRRPDDSGAAGPDDARHL